MMRITSSATTPEPPSYGQALPYLHRGDRRGGKDGVRWTASVLWISFYLILFVTATFAASLVAGIAGFAFGIVAAAAWLHFLTPARTTALIVSFGLIVQSITMWKLRHALKSGRLIAFIIGGAIGSPSGFSCCAGPRPRPYGAGSPLF